MERELARPKSFSNSVIVAFETADSSVSTPPSPCALSFRRIDDLAQDSIADLGSLRMPIRFVMCG